MKPRRKVVILVVGAVVLVLAMAGTAFAAVAATTENAMTTENATTEASATTTTEATTTMEAAETPTLRPHVEKHLTVLREQEKLARDVYAILYARWNEPVFRTIGAAESRLMESVKVILDRYGIEDPVGSNPPGVFTNERLQKAYGELVARGSKSLTGAYKVGVAIEKRIIANARDLIGDTARRDITRMSYNVLWSSQNHLAVFTRLLNK